MKSKDIENSIVSLSIVVLEVIEELDREGASLSPLLLDYKKELSLLRSRMDRQKDKNK